MTECLYHTDSYQTEFTAQVVAVEQQDGQPALVLDRSCFYPTSGGQPHDTGVLADRAVIDVRADAEGALRHLLAGSVDAGLVGETVTGLVDWARRYDHMQQHSGQHLLSQAFFRLCGGETLSVHFGATESTLDLDLSTIDAATLNRVETFANEQVYAGLTINAYFVTESELAMLSLRRPPAVEGRIRIVEIDRFDYSACGGTHCRSTAELGPIKLLKQERRKKRIRITFLCGWRAVHDYKARHDLLAMAAGHF